MDTEISNMLNAFNRRKDEVMDQRRSKVLEPEDHPVTRRNWERDELEIALVRTNGVVDVERTHGQIRNSGCNSYTIIPCL